MRRCNRIKAIAAETVIRPIGPIWNAVQSKPKDKMLSSHRVRAAGCVVLAKSERLELGYNILRTV